MGTMEIKEYEELRRTIFRNLMWNPKGAFPYYDEKDIKEIRLNILKELAKYKPSTQKDGGQA